jgi:hypothetical protein
MPDVQNGVPNVIPVSLDGESTLIVFSEKFDAIECIAAGEIATDIPEWAQEAIYA